ncbi:hypothetical protein ABIA33_001440 [Streptacidiphilus sp. MAP12-16]|uniref:hypothetical protein n=1 Tax=Streptacidiphilus sp. MAP12-16 TaxID=3156300 RepID=UPI0035121424
MGDHYADLADHYDEHWAYSLTGRLHAGDRLRSPYKGKAHEAELRSDGSICLFDCVYTSVSTAAVAVRHKVNGSDPSAPEAHGPRVDVLVGDRPDHQG